MDKFLLTGPCKVEGKIDISGSKNAALPILAATLLFDKPVELKNLPNVRDVQTMLALLKSLGSKIVISRNKKSVKIYNFKKKWSSFNIGWIFGFGYFISNLYWITNSLTFEEIFKPLIPFALIIIPLFLGIFYGLGTLICSFFNLRKLA